MAQLTDREYVARRERFEDEVEAFLQAQLRKFSKKEIAGVSIYLIANGTRSWGGGVTLWGWQTESKVREEWAVFVQKKMVELMSETSNIYAFLQCECKLGERAIFSYVIFNPEAGRRLDLGLEDAMSLLVDDVPGTRSVPVKINSEWSL